MTDCPPLCLDQSVLSFSISEPTDPTDLFKVRMKQKGERGGGGDKGGGGGGGLDSKTTRQLLFFFFFFLGGGPVNDI